MTLDELRAALADLKRSKGLHRVRLARELSDAAMATLAAVGDEAVWQTTRTTTWHEVAQQLGVSEAAVGKAIRLHNRRMTARIDSDKTKWT